MSAKGKLRSLDLEKNGRNPWWVDLNEPSLFSRGWPVTSSLVGFGAGGADVPADALVWH